MSNDKDHDATESVANVVGGVENANALSLSSLTCNQALGRLAGSENLTDPQQLFAQAITLAAQAREKLREAVLTADAAVAVQQQPGSTKRPHIDSSTFKPVAEAAIFVSFSDEISDLKSHISQMGQQIDELERAHSERVKDHLKNTIFQDLDLSTCIFNYLSKRDLIDSVSLVCKDWARACHSANIVCWHTMCIGESSGNIDTGEKLLQLIGRPQFAHLKKLRLPVASSLSDGITSTLLTDIARLVPNLEELFYQNCSSAWWPCHVVDKTDRLLSLFPQLFRSPCEFVYLLKDQSHTQEVLRLIELRGEVFTKIEMRGDSRWSNSCRLVDEDVIHIGRHCPNLKTLYCGGNNSARLPRIGTKALVELVKGCKKLEDLTVNRLDDDCYHSEHIGLIAEHGQCLRSLAFEHWCEEDISRCFGDRLAPDGTRHGLVTFHLKRPTIGSNTSRSLASEESSSRGVASVEALDGRAASDLE